MTFIISFAITIILSLLFIFSSKLQSYETGLYAQAMTTYFFIPVWLVMAFFVHHFRVLLKGNSTSAKIKLHSIVILEFAIGFTNYFLIAVTAPHYQYKVSKSLIEMGIFNIKHIVRISYIPLNWLGLIGISMLTLALLDKIKIQYPYLTIFLIACGFVSWASPLYQIWDISNLITAIFTLHLVYLGRNHLFKNQMQSKISIDNGI